MERTLAFKSNGKTHQIKVRIPKNTSDWWTAKKSKGETFDIHFDADYKSITVYHVGKNGADYSKQIHNQYYGRR